MTKIFHSLLITWLCSGAGAAPVVVNWENGTGMSNDYYILVNNRITWNWTDAMNHTLTLTNVAANKSVGSKVAPFNKTYVFMTAGDYPYKCDIHNTTMGGTIHVANCTNDPFGWVAAEKNSTHNCSTVGTKQGWNCDDKASVANHSAHVWELCPVACRHCEVGCFADQHKCLRGECVDSASKCPPLVCNSTTEFKCNDSLKCIPIANKCDNKTRDCADGSDETQALCGITCNSTTEFKCNDSSKCIPIEKKCDQTQDCDDGSDEAKALNCTSIACNATTEFKCSDGLKCIPIKKKCDQTQDCDDGSDEAKALNCTVLTCNSTTEFKCRDGLKCIPIKEKCDKTQDCADGSDEAKDLNCTSIDCNSTTQFKCADGSKCIPIEKMCDNKTGDCADGSDELPAVCKGKDEECLECGDIWKKCVAIPQCYEAQDRIFEGGNCSGILNTKAFLPDQYRKCWNSLYKEDRRGFVELAKAIDCYVCNCTRPAACKMGFDDLTACITDEFMCHKTTCLKKDQVCDGKNDCADKSDENACPTTAEPTPEVTSSSQQLYVPYLSFVVLLITRCLY